ncbi:MAG: Nif3-like dinuclear metal center hexameric protein [Rhodospirillaceae bacterium]
MLRDDLVAYLDEYLQVAAFRDYCPNGLQVEGRDHVDVIVTGVTASHDLLDAAVEAGADAVLVHHGYFWKGEDARITGMRRRRIGTLVSHDLNLIAYHLPLDAHPEIGNNATLARHLGIMPEGRFGDQNIGAYGTLEQPMPLQEFAEHVGGRLQRQPLTIGDPQRAVRRIAWCTGAAQGYFEQAAALGVDLYLTGEVSEQNFHAARESGVAFMAAGHHATERYGIEALGAHLAARFGLEHRFIEIANPV